MAVCVGVVLPLVSTPGLRATALEPASPVIEAAAFHGTAQQPERIVLYGDSLASEAGEDFEALATSTGAAVQVHTFPGSSPCDYFASMAALAQQWHPTVAVLAFTGDAFTQCMGGVHVGTPRYFTMYKSQTHAAISIFRSAGAKVVLVGQPADASARLTKNGVALNQLYRSIARRTSGVTYDDAGQAVMAKGRFTWTLPCLSGKPCSGPHRTNVIRAPDGVHFCPNGQTTRIGGLEQCDIYSSGAFRFASAMLKAAMESRVPAK